MGETQQLHVLVVDDSTEICLLASRWLQHAGVDVIEAVAVLDDVVPAVVSTEPDVVVLDLVWEGRSALAALAEIKSRCPQCAVVVFSGHDDVESVRETRKLGAHRFVGKRQDYDVLVNAVIAAGAEMRDARHP